VRRAALIALLFVACARREPAIPGDADHGKQLLSQYGCTSCHVIPGVKGPRGNVGPSLEHVATRTYLAGKLQNNVPNMTKWLQNPQVFDPQNAMPNLGVTPEDSRDITAYLYTLK
jgi:cytochrome c2